MRFVIEYCVFVFLQICALDGLARYVAFTHGIYNSWSLRHIVSTEFTNKHSFSIHLGQKNQPVA